MILSQEAVRSGGRWSVGVYLLAIGDTKIEERPSRELFIEALRSTDLSKPSDSRNSSDSRDEFLLPRALGLACAA